MTEPRFLTGDPPTEPDHPLRFRRFGVSAFPRFLSGAAPKGRVLRMRMLAGSLLLILLSAGACSPTQGNDLSKMQKARITIKGEAFEVWIARTEAEREKGLMFVTAEQLADTPEGLHRGMLFLFEQQKPLGFWMKNTITALDIAYINTDKTIVKTLTMKPLDESTYPSERPARYALEVKAQLFKSLHIASGDLVDIPDDVLKETP